MFVLLREFSQNHTRKPSQSAFVRWENAARGRIPQNSLMDTSSKAQSRKGGMYKKNYYLEQGLFFVDAQWL
jgi:hypothetical protein